MGDRTCLCIIKLIVPGFPFANPALPRAWNNERHLLNFCISCLTYIPPNDTPSSIFRMRGLCLLPLLLLAPRANSADDIVRIIAYPSTILYNTTAVSVEVRFSVSGPGEYSIKAQLKLGLQTLGTIVAVRSVSPPYSLYILSRYIKPYVTDR